MKWIEWIEPFGPNSEPVYLRVPAEVAISHTRAAHPGVYPRTPDGDELALEDFITVNWATVTETEDLTGICVPPLPSQGEKWGRLTEDETHAPHAHDRLPGVESKQNDSTETNRPVGGLLDSPDAQADRESAGGEAAEPPLPAV